MTTTTTGVYSLELSKKQIIQRLFEQGHISFNEMWTLLLDDNREVKYVTIPNPYEPYDPQWKFDSLTGNITCTNDNDIQGLHIQGRGEPNSGTPQSFSGRDGTGS